MNTPRSIEWLRIEHALAEITACFDGRDYSKWNATVSEWARWATYAAQGEW